MPYQPPNDELASQLRVLYKYRSITDDATLEQTLSMIRTRSLWFWHLTDQNDKNECNPRVFFGGNQNAIYKYFLNDFNIAFPNIDSEIIKKYAMGASRSPVIPKPSDVYRHWAVCCFSAMSDSALMWQRYATNGSGVAIAYRADPGSSMGLAGKVQYSDKVGCLDILNLSEDKIYEIFTTKEKKWMQEQEYRMVEKLDSAESGNNFYYPDVQIIKVVIGGLLDNAYVDKVESLCSELDIQTVVQQVPHEDAFSTR